MNAPIPHSVLSTDGPPWSCEAEQAVLGAMLIDPAAYDRVGDLLSAESFYLADHRTIFAAAGRLAAASKPCDVVSVYEALQAAGSADAVGGLVYLGQLANCVPSANHARRHAEIVAEKAAHRNLIAAAGKALDIAREADSRVIEKLERIGECLGSVERFQTRQAPRVMSELVRVALDRYNALAEGSAPSGWMTGIGPLDRLIHGLKPGKVYGIAARPSVGKSSAARTVAINIARAGIPTLVLSQEMPADEVTDCAIAEIGQVNSERLQTGELTDEDWNRIVEGVEAAAALPLHIDDEGGLTIAAIGSKARMVKGLKVLVLDYLQLSTSTLKNASTNDQVAEISRGLKQLALRMGIAVVVLSQLNRDVEKRVDKEPMLADLRDSGAIEQDLDVAVLLWTVKEEGEHDDTRLVGWKVAKHRGGKKGRFGMRWRAATNRWFPSDEDLSAPKPQRGGAGGFG